MAHYPLKPKNATRRALGSYGELTLETARDKARDWLSLIRRGVDPKIEEARQRATQRLSQAATFDATADRPTSLHAAKGLQDRIPKNGKRWSHSTFNATIEKLRSGNRSRPVRFRTPGRLEVSTRRHRCGRNRPRSCPAEVA